MQYIIDFVTETGKGIVKIIAFGDESIFTQYRSVIYRHKHRSLCLASHWMGDAAGIDGQLSSITASMSVASTSQLA